ncbi:unnamed protein product [Victoria cruziana]
MFQALLQEKPLISH